MHRVHPASTTRVRPEPTGQESGQVGGGHVDWGGRVTTGDVGTATHEHVRHWEPVVIDVVVYVGAVPEGHVAGHVTGGQVVVVVLVMVVVVRSDVTVGTVETGRQVHVSQFVVGSTTYPPGQGAKQSRGRHGAGVRHGYWVHTIGS
jgi:hypothetical protein